MMFKRYSKSYDIISYKYKYLICLYLLFISFTICEGAGDICTDCPAISDTNLANIQNINCNGCRFSVRKNNWYRCTSSNRYFYISSDQSCVTVSDCQQTVTAFGNEDKVVIPNYECVPSCSSINNIFKSNIYELGDFCIYDTTNQYYADKYNQMNINGYNKLSCHGCTLIETIDESNFHHCYECENCPTDYYDFDKKECIGKCDTSKKIRNVVNSKSECRNKCPIDEFEYTQRNEEDGIDRIYCLSQAQKCPTTAKYFYKSDFEASKCIENCNENDYYIEGENRCTLSCDGLIYKEDSKNFYTCRPRPSPDTQPLDCPNTHPYKYFDICLKSCADSQSLPLINEKTYSKIGDNGQPKFRCVDNCLTENLKVVEDTLSCVNDCKNTNNKFTYNSECISDCKNNYKKLYKDDDLYCVDECGAGYYKLDDICYKDGCPQNSGYPFHNDRNECIKCNKDQGFYINRCEESDQQMCLKCYESCPDGYLLHYYDDNICYRSSKEVNTCKNIGIKPYPYHINNNTCYPSCQSISPVYKFEKDYVCYKESEFNCPIIDHYFYTIGEMTTCVPQETYVKNCSKIGYNYLRGRECIKDCLDTEYKINYVDSIYEGMLSLGLCCENPLACKDGYNYYSKTEKIIRQNCPYKRIKTLDEIVDSVEGNCVLTCPSNEYPFETKQDDKIVCVQSCDGYYYIADDGSKKCIDNCRKLGMFHFKDSKECISKCSKNGKNYYYDKDTFICYEKCEETSNKPFAFEVVDEDEPQECRTGCPDPESPYYFEDKKFCLTKCDKNKGQYYNRKNENDKTCVNKCEEGNDKIINENYCTSKCELFYFPKTKDKITYNYCVSTCTDPENPSIKYNYYDSKTLECYKECPPKAPYQLGKLCYDQCPEGYYIDSNECKNNCNGKFYQKNKKGNYECVNNCDSKKFISSSKNECVDACPLGEHFIGENRKCKAVCGSEDGEYYRAYKDIKESEEANAKTLYTIYQCHNSINNDEFYVYNSKETVKNCPSDKPYKSKTEKMCYDLCKNSENSNYIFSYDDDAEGGEGKICSTECLGDKINYGEDKKCVKG